MIPGRLLHRIAARMCDANRLERIVEPAIADFQNEYAAAMRSARRRISILFDGYVGIVEAIAMSVLETSAVADDQRRALTRTFLWAVGATVCAVALLIVLTVTSLPGVPAFLVALIVPTQLPIALAVGLTLGIAFGLAGRVVSRRTQATVLLVAVLMIVVSFGAMAWSTSIPLGRHQFRQSLSNALGGHVSVTKGLHEVSLAQGRQQANLAPGGDLMAMPRRLAWTYHFRSSIACAPLALAMLALAAIARGARRAVVMSACAAYLGLIVAGEELVYRGLPPFAGAWLANIVFVSGTLALMVWMPPRGSRRSSCC
jgi:hypothetical protein